MYEFSASFKISVLTSTILSFSLLWFIFSTTPLSGSVIWECPMEFSKSVFVFTFPALLQYARIISFSKALSMQAESISFVSNFSGVKFK